MAFSVIDQLQGKTPDVFQTKFIWVGSGVGLDLGLELVCLSSVLFFFERSLVITLEAYICLLYTSDAADE